MTEAAVINEVDCPYCAERINEKAKKCKHCGEFLDHTLRELDLIKSNRKDVIISNNASASAASVAAGPDYPRTAIRSKGTAFLWAVFLGGLGAHKFYLGQPGWGILYLCLCWTGISTVVSLIEAVYFIVMSQVEFDRKYNWGK